MTLSIKKILIPIDFSEVSTKALRYGASLAQHYDASLVVLTVADDDSSWVVDLSDRVHVKERWREDRIAEGERLVEEFCAPILGDRPYKNVACVGTPADEIVRMCATSRADLLIMGAHGTTGVVSEWLGGVAYSVSKKAPCPVLMVKLTADEA